MRLRVLTYNMHKGFCFYSRQYVLHELRDAIRAVNADLVFLQEVMGVHPAEHGTEMEIDSQFEFLADEIWTHFAYGKNAVYSEGHHGNAILSKYPIIEFENINVSTNPLEQRGLLHAKLELPDQRLDVVCLHLDLLDRGRRQQMQRLIQHVKGQVDSQSALIIAGDFNDWQKKFSDPLGVALGVQETGVLFTGDHSPTFPSWKPFLTLDRIYIRGFRVHAYQVLYGLPWRRMSDHAAIVAEIEILPAVSGKRAN